MNQDTRRQTHLEGIVERLKHAARNVKENKEPTTNDNIQTNHPT